MSKTHPCILFQRFARRSGLPSWTNLPRLFAMTLVVWLGSGVCHADEYDQTIQLFKHAGESAVFFADCYAYAVFPTIGAGA